LDLLLRRSQAEHLLADGQFDFGVSGARFLQLFNGFVDLKLTCNQSN
jgi:hypothetical protein